MLCGPYPFVLARLPQPADGGRPQSPESFSSLHPHTYPYSDKSRQSESLLKESATQMGDGIVRKTPPPPPSKLKQASDKGRNGEDLGRCPTYEASKNTDLRTLTCPILKWIHPINAIVVSFIGPFSRLPPQRHFRNDEIVHRLSHPFTFKAR